MVGIGAEVLSCSLSVFHLSLHLLLLLPLPPPLFILFSFLPPSFLSFPLPSLKNMFLAFRTSEVLVYINLIARRQRGASTSFSQIHVSNFREDAN